MPRLVVCCDDTWQDMVADSKLFLGVAAADVAVVARRGPPSYGGGGRADRQQPEHLPEDQIQQPQRHIGIMPTRRSPLVSDPARVLEPHR